MNLYEFCNDEQILQYAKESTTDLKIKPIFAEKMAMLSIQYYEIRKSLSQCNAFVQEGYWEQEKADILQDMICDKLLICKFSFQPDKGSLLAYISSMVSRMLIDNMRKISSRRETPIAEDNHPIAAEHPNDQKAPALVLTKEHDHEVRCQTCLRRTIVKLWRPYLFQYEFEPDERNLLESKGQNLEALITQLKEIITAEINAGHQDITVSPDHIARWLQISRDAVDRHLCILRKKLPWLRKENLRHALV